MEKAEKPDLTRLYLGYESEEVREAVRKRREEEHVKLVDVCDWCGSYTFGLWTCPFCGGS